MISQLYEKVNYISGLRFIFSNYIREYDLSKANINVLYSKGVIDYSMYAKLLVASREERQITIGLLERENKEVINILKDGIIEAKKMLFEANDIQDGDILSIKNDAVFVINKWLNYTKFGDYIEFKLKSTFTSFVYLNGIEIYYGYDKISGIENIQTKGLGKKEYLHTNFMIDFIAYLFSEMEVGDVKDAISSLSDFYMDYVSGNLDIGYYREFNSESMYSIINSSYKVLYMDNDEYTKKRVVNMNYNLNILRTLYGYISDQYFRNIKF